MAYVDHAEARQRSRRPNRATAANGMIAPPMLPIPLTMEIPRVRILVGYSSEYQAARVVLVSMPKNWKVAPSTRIRPVSFAKRATQGR